MANIYGEPEDLSDALSELNYLQKHVVPGLEQRIAANESQIEALWEALRAYTNNVIVPNG